eukprot:c28562_g3_i2 orf=676-3363(+)
MDDSLETNNMPLVAIDKQGFCISNGDIEHQASSSGNYPGPLSVGNTNSFKKSRVDEGDFWHGSNPCRNDSWRSPATIESCQVQLESSHVQSLHGIQRPKRQSCTSVMQGQWDALHAMPGTLDDLGLSSSRGNMGMEGSLDQSSIPGFSGFSNAPSQGVRGADFDFFGSDTVQASNNSCFTSCWPSAGNDAGAEFAIKSGGTLEDDKIGSWSGTSLCHLGVPRLGDVGSDLVCHSDGVNMEEKYTGDLISNSSDTIPRGTVDYQITNLQNFSTSADSMNMKANMNQDINGTEGNCGLEPSLSSYSASLLGSEGGMPPLLAGHMSGYSADNSSVRVGQSHSGRRGSCKRKSSSLPGITGPLPFCSPQPSGRRDTGLGRPINGAGSSRLDIGNLTFAAASATVDTFQNSSATAIGHVWEDSQNRSTVLGIEKDNSPESFRGTVGSSASLSGVNGGHQRSVRIRSTSMQPEQSLSQFHAPFSRNTRRSLSVSQTHTRSSRRFHSVEQPVESNANGNASSSATPMLEVDHWSGSLFNQRNSDPSSAGSWGRNSLFSRRNNNHHGIIAPPRVPGLFEGSQTRSLSGVPPSWLGTAAIDSRLISQINLDSTSQAGAASTGRGITGQENHAHTSQMGESTLVFAGTSNSLPASHLSSLVSTRRNRGNSQGHMFPTPTVPAGANNLVPSSFATAFEVVPSPATIYQGPHTPGMRPSFFVGGHGENILVSPLQSILGMPLRGIHVLPTEGESRHRVFTEILAALEHARRNNELSFEEWVMLDPSVIFGGIDMHDQHSDMRLDVDNMSYEELLALEERIGNVSTGLSDETIAKCLRTSKYTSLDATVAVISQESEVKCSVCQEEYVEEDDLGRLECSHGFHATCIRQWLLQKNQCPICKAAAYTKS